jgi:hypothetical protein
VCGWIQLRDFKGPIEVAATAIDGAAIKGRLIEAGWELPIGTPATTSYLIRVHR